MLYKRRSVLQRLVLKINERFAATSPDPEQFQTEREARGLLRKQSLICPLFFENLIQDEHKESE